MVQLQFSPSEAYVLDTITPLITPILDITDSQARSERLSDLAAAMYCHDTEHLMRLAFYAAAGVRVPRRTPPPSS